MGARFRRRKEMTALVAYIESLSGQNDGAQSLPAVA